VVLMRPDTARHTTATASPTGVILLGGAHGALAMARSFGRHRVPTVLVSNDHPMPRLSRYVGRQFRWPGAGAADAARWLVALAESHDLAGWLLLPCADNDVRLIASHRQQLSRTFHIVSCDWETLSTVCDKQALPTTAAAAGVAAPRNYRIGSEHDI